MTPEEIDAKLKQVETWINASETWNNDLDGYSGIDLAEAVLREVRRVLIGDQL